MSIIPTFCLGAKSGAEVIEVREAAGGGVDCEDLALALHAAAGAEICIGSFSAASNVTGILTDTDAVTRILKAHGAISIWDYAGGGPYLPIDMRADSDCAKDAVVVSPHKFLGGPAASGVMILRKDGVARVTPVQPGGGTVRFVSPHAHEYVADLATREEAGTPDVIGDIRAGLAFLVKEAIGQAQMDRRHAEFEARARAIWGANPYLELLGVEHGPRLPIFSFRVRDGQGGYLHHQLFTRMLSDGYGIQARGGCACAGPYAHRLLGIDAQESAEMLAQITAGEELRKPGWVRLNFSVLLEDAKADRIISAVDTLARDPSGMLDHYTADPATARFTPKSMERVA